MVLVSLYPAFLPSCWLLFAGCCSASGLLQTGGDLQKLHFIRYGLTIRENSFTKTYADSANSERFGKLL
jgi:hypothetical protein